MNASMKKMARNQNMSMCAADKCLRTEEVTFTVRKMPWGLGEAS